MALVLRKAVLPRNVSFLKCMKGRHVATTSNNNKNNKNPAAITTCITKRSFVDQAQRHGRLMGSGKPIVQLVEQPMKIAHCASLSISTSCPNLTNSCHYRRHVRRAQSAFTIHKKNFSFSTGGRLYDVTKVGPVLPDKFGPCRIPLGTTPCAPFCQCPRCIVPAHSPISSVQKSKLESNKPLMKRTKCDKSGPPRGSPPMSFQSGGTDPLSCLNTDPSGEECSKDKDPSDCLGPVFRPCGTCSACYPAPKIPWPGGCHPCGPQAAAKASQGCVGQYQECYGNAAGNVQCAGCPCCCATGVGVSPNPACPYWGPCGAPMPPKSRPCPCECCGLPMLGEQDPYAPGFCPVTGKRGCTCDISKLGKTEPHPGDICSCAKCTTDRAPQNPPNVGCLRQQNSNSNRINPSLSAKQFQSDQLQKRCMSLIDHVTSYFSTSSAHVSPKRDSNHTGTQRRDV